MSLKQLIYKGEAESFRGLMIIGIAIFAVVATVLIGAFLIGELKWYVAP